MRRRRTRESHQERNYRFPTLYFVRLTFDVQSFINARDSKSIFQFLPDSSFSLSLIFSSLHVTIVSLLREMLIHDIGVPIDASFNSLRDMRKYVRHYSRINWKNKQFCRIVLDKVAGKLIKSEKKNCQSNALK